MSYVLLDRAIFSDLESSPAYKKSLTVNDESVKYSVANLLSTVVGERLNLVSYGVVLEDYIFELIDEITAWSLLNSFFYAVSKWEPRVILNTQLSSVIPTPDENAYTINLYFEIRGFEGLDFTLAGLYKRSTEK